MPESGTGAPAGHCLICYRPAALSCQCGREYCGELLAVLIGAGVDRCDCGIPWDWADAVWSPLSSADLSGASIVVTG